MSVNFDRHNAVFARHLGKAATFTPAGGASVQLTIVKAEMLQAFPDGAAAAMEAVWVQRSALPQAPAHGDSVQIGDKARYIVSIRDDREGGLYLALN